MADVAVAPEVQQAPPPPEAPPRRIETVSAKKQFDIEREKVESDTSKIEEALEKTIKEAPGIDFKPEQDEFLGLSKQLGTLNEETDRELGPQTEGEPVQEAQSEEIDVEELVERKLQPRAEMDNADFERKIYTINGFTFSFRGREELPIYSTAENSRTRLLGEASRWVSKEDFQAYQDQIKKTEAQTGAPEHYLANKTLSGVVELTIQLGSKDPTLVQIRDEIQKGVYSPKALEIIDGLIALNYIDHIKDPNNAKYLGNPSTNAEAIMVMALMGDQEARITVSQKMEEIRKLDAERKAREKPESVDAEPMNPKELVAVHATRFMPEKTPEGNYSIPTTFDATGGEKVRNSIHVALNHKVESNNGGDWEAAPYTIISPFESMVQVNGLPRALLAVDTYWTRNPGETLKFPDANLVIPGDEKQESLIVVEGKVTKFKTGNYTEKDLLELRSKYQELGMENFDKAVGDMFNSSYSDWKERFPESIQNQWDLDKLGIAIGSTYISRGVSRDYLQRELPSPKGSRILNEIIQNVETEGLSIEESVKKALEKANVLETINPDVQDPNQALNELSAHFTRILGAKMNTAVNRLAVNETIKNMGAEVKQGGDYGWEDSDADDRVLALGEKLGVDLIGPHSTSVEKPFENNLSRAVNRTIEASEDEKFDWRLYDNSDIGATTLDVNNLVPELDQKTRRILYASGLLTARS